MTPLAFELAQDLYDREGIYIDTSPHNLPQKKIAFILNGYLENAKFFDCGAIWPMATHLGQSMREEYEATDRYDGRLAFLPDGIVWIESEMPSVIGLPQNLSDSEWSLIRKSRHTYRTAHIFSAKRGGYTDAALRSIVGYETPRPSDRPRVWHYTQLPTLPLVHSGLKPPRYKTFVNVRGEKVEHETATSSAYDFVHYAALALINSPRIIGRHQHMPHERAERDKLKGLKLVGKFPLRAWTEIILKVALPDDRSGEPSTEAHLTGERCLHFCRAHIRVRMGLIEYVAGHWRGNPALGMKRSRYVVTS